MNTSNILPFGKTPKGEPIYRICLKNDQLSCEVITYGAALRVLKVPDRNGKPVDIVLGYDTPEQYLSEEGYLGATVGRFANRIAKGSFTLNGQRYSLPINNGNNHLHGGTEGFSHRVWEIQCVTEDTVTLCLTSPDGDQGYPGTLKATAEYILRDNALIIRHTAVSDKDTICSLTNHSYFNLSGHNSGSAMDQKIKLLANEFTPSDAESIPLGTILPVEGTPMDLRELRPIHTHINDSYTQLKQAKGYDHNYIVDGACGVLRPAAIATSDLTGITMQVDTTLPGIQLYTANFVNEGRIGKGNCTYGPRHAFCLETQYYPDAINQPSFPSPILKAGDLYAHKTVFRFPQP